jgi:hypothetical protein
MLQSIHAKLVEGKFSFRIYQTAVLDKNTWNLKGEKDATKKKSSTDDGKEDDT